MCLGVPGRMIEIKEKEGLNFARMALVGISREVCLDYLPEAAVGDYCIVHVGFAIRLLSRDEAQQLLVILKQMARLGDGELAAPIAMPGAVHGTVSQAAEGCPG